MSRIACAALFLFPLVSSPGCALPTKKAEVTDQVPAASERVLWEVSKLAMESQGFIVVDQGFDPKTRSAQSVWRMDLHPFKGHGFRERVHLSYAYGAPGEVDLTVRVEKQENHNIAKPLDPEYAKWKAADDDEGRARLILQSIQSRLGGQLKLDQG